MSHAHCSAIDHALRTCTDIASSTFFAAKPRWAAEGCFALLLINLKDALQLLNILGRRISFTDEIENAKDVTDLVAQMRNAICHNGSPLRLIDPASNALLSFATVAGNRTPSKINGRAIENPHHDDVAFFYGNLRIFLVRHIRRALQDAEAALTELAKEHGYRLTGR